MELDARELQSEDDLGGRGTGGKPATGLYHVAVSMANQTTKGDKNTVGLEVEFQVINDGLTGYKKVFEKRPNGGRVMVALENGSETEGQAGKTIGNFFAFSGANEEKTAFCRDNLTRFALAVGVLQPGIAADPDWDACLGRELIVEVQNDKKYTDKQGQERMGVAVAMFGFWSLGNKAVSRVPKDTTTPGMQQLAKSGGSVKHPAAGSDGNGEKAPAIPAAPAAAVGTSRGRFSDL